MANNVKNSPKCSIPGCKTRSGQNKNIQFHKIRKYIRESNKEQKKWLEILPFMKNEDFLKSNYLICSLHFTDDDYICRPIRNFKRAWDLKSNAIPSLNLPKSNLNKKKETNRIKLKLQDDINKITDLNDCVLDIEYINDTDMVQITECECGKRVATANVGIQCEIIGSFDYNDVEEFLHENFEIFENYIERRKKVEKSPSYNTVTENELLKEMNDVEVIRNEEINETTCDLPNDDVFFNEILNKNNHPKLFKTAFHCCEHCGLIFTDFRSYRDHEGVHAEISLLCYFCGEYSPDYMKHIEHEYKCKKIKKIENGEIIPIKKRKKLKSNISDMDMYNEDLNKSIITKNNENNHSLNKSAKVNDWFVTYSCSICHELFENEETLTDHYNAHNSLECTEDIKKEMNDESYINEYKLSGETTIEFLNYSKNQSEEFSCKICDKSYATEYLLNRHIDVKHLNPIQKNPLFQCNECAMTFRNLQKYQSHIREHVVTLKYCKICNIMHDNNTKYLKHLRNPKHLTLEENWKNRYNIELFACSLCKTDETKYKKLSELADHSDYHRISKTRTFINSSLIEHEISFLKC